VVADALDTEYENGVADVLAYLAGDTAIVERNVRMPAKKGGGRRQIDVLVTGAVFGSGNATMVVDCKRYKKPLNVNHVGTFVGLVEDVGADIGLLVTTMGMSPAARKYADNVRGIRLDVLSIEQLAAWSPRGTVHFDYAVPKEVYPEAMRAVRRAGFRVRPIELDESRGDIGVGFSAFRHFGVLNPSGEQQTQAREHLEAALRRAEVFEPLGLGNGIVMGGGTPGHRWLEVTVAGVPTGLKVLVSSEEEVAAELDSLAEVAPREQLDVIRPDIWPIPIMFPRW
jgi:Restriction endonuclease